MATKQPTTPPSPPAKSKNWRGFFLFLIVVAIAASYLSYYLWEQLYVLKQQIAEQNAALNREMEVLQTQLKQVEATYQEQAAKTVQTLDTKVTLLTQQQQRTEGYIATLTHQVRRPQDNTIWVTAEVLYLFNIAQQRLTFMQDVEGAIAALVAADKRLEEMNDPTLQPVKAQLIEHLTTLRSLKLPAIDDFAQRLTEQLATIEKLPFAQGIHQNEESLPVTQPVTPTGNSFVETVWQEAQKLFVIRYNPQSEKGLLTEAQQQLISQNLAVKLETVRLYLLQRDRAHLKIAIQAVNDWLTRYYDGNDRMVTTLTQDLAQLQQVALIPSLPDILDMIELLQRLTIAPVEVP